MGKTSDLFKKIRDIKGTFYAKMGSIKDRNGSDLTEAEDTKKRWHVLFVPSTRVAPSLRGLCAHSSHYLALDSAAWRENPQEQRVHEIDSYFSPVQAPVGALR